MKHVDLFSEFLTEIVDLNDTRIRELENSIVAIRNAVSASAWEPRCTGWMAHGSWAHKTIIKPVDQGEFDADLIVFVESVANWNAAKYIDTLYDAFKANATYQDKASRSSHCVTIIYANEKKIDIAPCIVNRDGIERLEVCNRNTSDFESTQPILYTDWLVQQNSYSSSNSFRKVTRLIKYLRNIKTRFTCPSVLLTTVLGYRINSLDKNSGLSADAATALKTLLGRLDDWLQINPVKPVVVNPYLSSENFAELWTNEQYINFRECIHTYREWVDDAYDEQDYAESIAKWRRVFGDDFASGVVINAGKSAGNLIVADMRRHLVEAYHFTGDLVDAIKRFGDSILPASFNRLPYMQAPQWKLAPNQKISVDIYASLHRNKLNNYSIREVRSLEPLPAGFWLQFRATTTLGLPFTRAEYKIMWRVTNTDEEAARNNALRGRFEMSDSDNHRWEQLQYRGVHLVEAFVLRKRDDRIVGQSTVFRVMVE